MTILIHSVMYRDCLTCAVQKKWLNWSGCSLGSWVWWVQATWGYRCSHGKGNYWGCLADW